MKQIDELILFRSKDKDPYRLNNDTIFAKVIPSINEIEVIDELSLLSYDFRFTECMSLSFDYQTSLEQENKQVYQSSSDEQTFNISGIVSTGNNIFTSDDRLDFSQFSSNRYQAIFKTNDQTWFILYAELVPQSVSIENDIVVGIQLEANNVKEKLYRISEFNLIPAAAQLINIDTDEIILLDTNGNLTINIDGNNL